MYVFNTPKCSINIFIFITKLDHLSLKCFLYALPPSLKINVRLTEDPLLTFKMYKEKENNINKGCLPFTEKFRKFRLGCKW